MTDAPPDPTSQAQDSAGPDLQKIDEILEKEDPEFTQGLQTIKAQVTDTSVEIESLVPVEDGLQTDSSSRPGGPANSSVKESWIGKFLNYLRRVQSGLRQKASAKWKQARIALRTLPKEFAMYAFVQLKVLLRQVGRGISWLFALPFYQKLGFLLLFGLLWVTMWLVQKNLGGSWLPSFQEAFLSNHETVADEILVVEPGEMVLLREALPQPEFQVLLEKMVVNFKRRPGVAENPMGTFEIFVGVDSHDAAVEVRARQRELLDDVSRALEGLTYPEVSGPLGVEKIKMAVKEAVSQAITQGTVHNVYLKMSIIKP